MVNKKYLLLAGFCSVMAAQPVLAQESQTATASWSGRDMTYRGESYDVLDSSYYPKGRMVQYRRYMNHQSVYPPKPQNMWEVGVNVGAFNVIGDITTKSPFSGKKFTDALGFGLTVRKALGYAMSLRLQYTHGTGNGFDYQLSQPLNAGWKEYNSPIYMNYKVRYNEFTLQMVGAINNINFHRARNTMSLYGFLGTGYANYKTDINKYNGAAGNLYNFQSIPTYGQRVRYEDRKETNDDIKTLLDDDFETKGVRDRNFVPIVMGLGLQFKLSSRVVLQLEDKLTFTFDDDVDNKNLTNSGNLTPDKDMINYGSVGLNFNLGNKRKNVAPLWWVNPLDHAYSELSDPRHMRLPDPILPDSDGDGIADQFDKCPGTPAGVAVDSHGCPMDTDGDGVPDFKDKQLITPTECQPVDADGIGKCPCPDGCGGSGVVTCGSISSGSLNFTGNSSRISPAIGSQLTNLAAQMSANPTCKVVIIGAGNASKMQQQRSWDRVNAVIEYMSEKHGIDRNRFIFQYGVAGDENSVMYRSANVGEEGPGNVPPPFPNLRKD